MNKGRSELGAPILKLILLIGACLVLSACSILQDTIDGLRGADETKVQPEEADVIMVTLIVESDGDRAHDFEAVIQARKHPQSVYYDTITLPYKEEFTVPKDVFIPLSSTLVQAEKAADASWISCTILYDGEVVTTHRSSGDRAKAVCEKTFRLGPG